MYTPFYGVHNSVAPKKEYIMAIENVLRQLKMKLERQQKAVAETQEAIRELEQLNAKAK